MFWLRPICGIILSFLPFLTVFFGQPLFQLDYFWWKISGVVAIIFGFGILGLSYYEMKRQGAVMRFKEDPGSFVKTGPYQYVRHPYYLGLVFVWVGWWWIWAAVYSFYLGMIILALLWIQAYLEEKYILNKQFGDEYRKYKQVTGMFWIK